jgi:two-component system chemotaxis response regulator CheB
MTSPASNRSAAGATGSIGAVVVGGSAGGIEALRILLGALPADFPAPVLAVIHLDRGADDYLVRSLAGSCPLRVLEAEQGMPVEPGCVYLAPANYHLLAAACGGSIAGGAELALSIDPPVNFSRPSIDCLFESAAEAWGPALAAVILSGASADGARGLVRVKGLGGLALVQDPTSAASPEMPRAALAACEPDFVGAPEAIAERLFKRTKGAHPA